MTFQFRNRATDVPRIATNKNSVNCHDIELLNGSVDIKERMVKVRKSIIPEDTMESMKEFFMKTSVPRMIARKKEEQKQCQQKKNSSSAQ